MGVFVQVRGRGSLVAGAALAAAMIGRCAVCADTRPDGASSTRAAPRGSGSADVVAATRLAALARAARGRATDWRIGNVPSVRVQGEVLIDGEPVVGADVRVGAPPGSAEVTATSTDGRGRFDLGYQDPLELQVVARRGERRGIRDVDLGAQVARGGAWLTIALEPCETWVTGRLVDRAGRPLAGIPLHEEVGGWRPGLVEAGRSAADGTFRVCGREVRAGGGSLALVELHGPDAGDIVLAPPFTIRGQVIRAGGEPVASAIVEVSPRRNGARMTARSDRSGAWTAEVASGCVALSAWHRGEYAQLNQPGEPEECFGHRALEICGEAGDTVVTPPVVLERCRHSARGLVRVAGKPTAGLVVSFGDQRDLTDASGHFSVECSDGSVKVAGHELDFTAEMDGEDMVLDIDATPSPWIRGRVTMAGQPLRGASVRIGDDESLSLPVLAVTARDGSYAVQVPAGTIAIAAEGPSGITTAPPHRVVVVEQGARDIRVDLDMGTPTAIQGSVHLEDGAAAARVQFILFRTPTSPVPLAFARTDDRGFFQLAPPPGTYVLEVTRGTWMLADGRRQIPLTVTEGGSLDLDLTVAPYESE